MPLLVLSITHIRSQNYLTGCEYGDHYASCETLERRECYFRSYRDACCATCALLESDNPGTCVYGLVLRFLFENVSKRLRVIASLDLL